MSLEEQMGRVADALERLVIHFTEPKTITEITERPAATVEIHPSIIKRQKKEAANLLKEFSPEPKEEVKKEEAKKDVKKKTKKKKAIKKEEPREELLPEIEAEVTVTEDELIAEARRNIIVMSQDDTFLKEVLADHGYSKISQVSEEDRVTIYEKLVKKNNEQ